MLDRNRYPAGTKISDEQMQDLEDRALTRHEFHGEWNCTFLPAARPAPPPAPPPAAPGPDLDTLAHPALTGMPRAAFDALAASIEVPYAAAREQRLHLDRGRPRRKNAGPPAPVKLSLAAYLAATLCRYRLGLSCQLIATLLGVHHSTISDATRHTASLLRQHGTVITPGPHRLRTLDDLRRHAAAAGITIPGPPQPHTADSTSQARDTP